MEYLDIIEENFTKSDYVAYLRGSILMWLLEDKPFDTEQFKLYADKLVEVLEKQRADTADDECRCLQTQVPEPTVDPDEPKVQPKHEFKLGDDGKQAIYQSMDGSIEHYRVCKVL